MPVDVVAIGTSTGGPNALAEVVREFPADFPVPIVIVQHMPPVFTRLLAERLDSQSPLKISEASDGDELRAGHVYLAPGNYHMTVKREGMKVRIRTNQEPPENSCRPAVDVLFRSVANVYGAGSLGVILTGMGQDGLRGCERIREVGGQNLAGRSKQCRLGNAGIRCKVRLRGSGFAFERHCHRNYSTSRQRPPGEPPNPRDILNLMRDCDRRLRGEREKLVTLEVQEFEFIRSLLQKRSAIVLDDEKYYLVESRLQPLACREGFSSVGELVFKLKTSQINGLHQKVIEAMTTHETSFFRDTRPFEALRRSVLPERIAAQSVTRKLRIWCMACSTGQEPYSLAMLIRDAFPQLQSWDVSIVATDISTQILEKAREGVFSQLENQSWTAIVISREVLRSTANPLAGQ